MVLLAGFVPAALSAQTSAPTQPVTAPSANGSSTAATGSRANGVPPSAPGLTGTAPSQPDATGGGTTTAGGKNQPPAPAATDKVEVTGRPTQSRTATQDHPLLPIMTPGNGFGIRSGTPISVRLKKPVDSGHAQNGDMVDGTLAKPLAGLAAGTPVRLTVVESSPAGKLMSYGELSLQVVSIADHRVLSDTITAQGKEGAKELPDAAPARGTEAIFTPDQPISLPAS